MGDSCLDTSISFEIPVHESVPRSPFTPKTPRAVFSPNRSQISVTDLTDRLEKADQRRSSVLSETRAKNEQLVLKAKTICETEKEKLSNRSLIIKETLEEDLARKAERRQQALEDKVKSAKRQVEKVEKVTDAHSTSRENLMRNIDKDMTNKENKRQSIIENIRLQCKIQVEKVDQVRSRRSMNHST